MCQFTISITQSERLLDWFPPPPPPPKIMRLYFRAVSNCFSLVYCNFRGKSIDICYLCIYQNTLLSHSQSHTISFSFSFTFRDQNFHHIKNCVHLFVYLKILWRFYFHQSLSMPIKKNGSKIRRRNTCLFECTEKPMNDTIFILHRLKWPL